MKRTALTASALSVLALATLTACGGDKEPDNSTGEPRPTTSQAQQATPAQRLAQLMVRPANVDGFSVDKPDAEFAFATSPEEVKVDKPACAPLAYAMNQLPLGDPTADLTRVVSKSISDAHTHITLTTYETGAAQPALADVRKALSACGDGFTAKASGGTNTYDSVTEEKVAPAGDETLGFKATMTFRGISHTLHTQVVRKADVLGVYHSVDGLAIAQARPSDAKLSAAVVKAQNAKLG
ncbi:hypothetical protein N4P33_07875 [Streptomyces sp. 15-116A]|uniref:hypothetical protein n=1 Tax=Streptomyces sp. 15-116A TaxID=2259035 RepID=UPI0021B1B1E8|nr:hypothetical protein [Streptomyces sp. 15-116A]MCT7352091.1 hypothetical protein [Streptomyces sp. 15-116A]